MAPQSKPCKGCKHKDPNMSKKDRPHPSEAATHPDRFYVGFDTNSKPGKLLGVYVIVGQAEVADTEAARIDLASHPLYPQIEAYVMGNLMRDAPHPANAN